MKRVAQSLLLTSMLSGCAETTHLTRTRTLATEVTPRSGQTPAVISDRYQAFFIDAKQRAIIQRGPYVCAEPSPDALSAIAASQGLSVATPEGTSVGGSLSLAEAAGSLGLRTQSIQLMRDHMYRICEGFLSGAIPQLTFQILHRRFQTTMVGILAIEQMTGAVRAPAIMLSGSSGVGDAQAVVQLTASREAIATSVSEAETGLKTAQAADKAAKEAVVAAEKALAAADAAGKEAATKDLAARKETAQTASGGLLEAEGKVAGRKATLAAIDRQLVQARAGSFAGTTGAIEGNVGMSSATAQVVATTIGQIVKDTMGLANANDFCVMVLAEAATGAASTIDVKGPIVQDCRKTLLGPL